MGKTELSRLNTLLKKTLIPVSAHVSPPPPGFGFVGLQGMAYKHLAQ